ncbi:YoaK family protein [Flavobacterium sp. LC2016-23]|uniref:YoaK family protein n=1 Tax=Flavobacterium sp. LC2016-23 TaxID=2666330 RepID=UPI0012B0B8D7|nr:YoaK family protein [Flavobacterium sp. LC2016-23]
MFSQTEFTITPDQIRTQEKLAVFLAFIAGYLDAVGILKWKIYVSFMSGNTTQLGVALSSGKLVVMITTFAVIACFMLGIYAGTCLSLWKNSKTQTLPFYIVSGILLIYTGVAQYYNISIVLSIAVIGFSTGVMNTIVTSVGNQNINTDFVTGTLNSLSRSIAMLSMSGDQTDKKQYKINAMRLSLLWIGFISGAFTSPFVLPRLGNWTLSLPAIALVICSLLLPIKNFNLKK